MKDGVLFYNGRILPDSKITIVGRYTEAMLNLSATSFCVPLIEKCSPIAFSIISDVQWNSQSSHTGIVTTLRQVMKKAFIIEGRSLVKLIKNSCKRCKYLNKRTVEAVMGPVPDSSLTIAPAFYHTQLDLSGPYKAFSPHKKYDQGSKCITLQEPSKCSSLHPPVGNTCFRNCKHHQRPSHYRWESCSRGENWVFSTQIGYYHLAQTMTIVQSGQFILVTSVFFLFFNF